MDSAEKAARARLGTTLRDKYHLDDLLGLGGMAAVYAATHRNRARFAIKMLHAHYAVQADIRTRFLREGYAGNSVGHPGVVLAVDDDADDSDAFIVMELLEGLSVEQLLERSGRLRLDLAVGILEQLLEVLGAAHAKGIVHRDIKPANLFLTREGQLKVLDFGIARVREQATTFATGNGQLLGTPPFMAPEQAQAKLDDIDARTDLWAAGATFFNVVTGRTVHDGDNPHQVLVKAATQKAAFIGDLDPQMPRALALVIDRALAYDQTDRWQSAAEMARALDKSARDTCGSMGREELARIVDPHRHSLRESPAEPPPVPSPVGDPAASTSLSTTAASAAMLPQSAASPADATTPRRSNLGVVIGGVIVGAAAIAAAIIVLVGTRPSTAPSTTSATASPPAGSSLASMTSTPSDERVTIPNSTATVSAITPAATDATPPGSGALAPRASATTPRPSTPAPIKKAAAPMPPSATPAAASSAPRCELVETVDADGHHHFKKVCK